MQINDPSLAVVSSIASEEEIVYRHNPAAAGEKRTLQVLPPSQKPFTMSVSFCGPTKVADRLTLFAGSS